MKMFYEARYKVVWKLERLQPYQQGIKKAEYDQVVSKLEKMTKQDSAYKFLQIRQSLRQGADVLEVSAYRIKDGVVTTEFESDLCDSGPFLHISHPKRIGLQNLAKELNLPVPKNEQILRNHKLNKSSKIK